MRRCLLALFLTNAALAAQPGELPADTLVTWQSYGQTGVARIQTFEANDEDRPVTVVIDELAENPVLVTDDVRYFVETFGRGVDLDPATATFVFRLSGASFEAEGEIGKTLLLRATFNRTKAGRLGSPSWRVITRDELAELTDRALY